MVRTTKVPKVPLENELILILIRQTETENKKAEIKKVEEESRAEDTNRVRRFYSRIKKIIKLKCFESN